jgi:hypothetical protein
MSAAELISEAYDQGITLTMKDGNIVCRSAEPLSEELKTRLRSNKKAVLQLLKKRQYGTPYLSETGEFRVRGGLLKESILDALLQVGACNTEIEKHIGPIHQPTMWKQWQLKKESRTH